MLRKVFPYVLGLLLGVPLVLLSRRLRNRSFPYRLGVGLLVGADGLLQGDVRAWHANSKPKLEVTYSQGQLIVLSNR